MSHFVEHMRVFVMNGHYFSNQAESCPKKRLQVQMSDAMIKGQTIVQGGTYESCVYRTIPFGTIYRASRVPASGSAQSPLPKRLWLRTPDHGHLCRRRRYPEGGRGSRTVQPGDRSTGRSLVPGASGRSGRRPDPRNAISHVCPVCRYAPWGCGCLAGKANGPAAADPLRRSALFPGRGRCGVG